MHIENGLYTLLIDSINSVDKRYRLFTYWSSQKYPSKLRERVFCYELYHQIRKKQEESAYRDIDVNGEPDKRGQERFAHITGPIPDMIIHKAGAKYANYIVLEAKCNLSGQEKNPKSGNPTGVYKDFKNLADFILTARYKYGVFLAIGVKERSLNKKFTKLAHFLCDNYPNDIETIFSALRIIRLDEQDGSMTQYLPQNSEGEYLLKQI